MAHRTFFQFRYSLEPNVVDLFAEISIGSSGAPTLVRGKGIKSITRNSAGDYTLALQENFAGLLQVSSSLQNATGIPSVVMGIKANNVSSSSAPGIEFVCSASGLAADPASGDVIRLQLSLRNSSL
jgi:hypothetical protein